MIIARLPVKTINTTPKLVCKLWKSIIESRSLRDLFQSLHQYEHPSSWSLMCRGCETEIIANYGSDNWDLSRSLGSYISSFLTYKFQDKNEARVVSYTDVGLILIHRVSNQSFYVANPVSRQCVEVFPLASQKDERFWILGIVTRTQNGVVLGYKVVLLKRDFTFLVYSSETGLWSIKSASFPFSFIAQEFNNPISLNGSLHWLAKSPGYQDFVVSLDFYDMSSNPCRATPFPDLDKAPKYKRTCTASQGFLTYMNIFSLTKADGNLEYKLCVWRLENVEWQLVSNLSVDFIQNGFSYIPLGINPFDAKRVYFWRMNVDGQCLLSINLHNGDFVIHNEKERSSDGRFLSSVDCPRDMNYMSESQFATFVLPLWLHPFPNTVRRV